MLEYNQASVTELAPYRTGAWLAERPSTVKGSREPLWPARAMLAFLSEDLERTPDA